MTRLGTNMTLAIGALAVIVALAPGPRAADDPAALKTLAESRAKAARQIADFYADPRLAALDGKGDARGIPGLDTVEVWTRRFVDARLDSSSGRDDRVAILTEDVGRTKAIEARLKALAENTPGFNRLDTLKAEYYRLDAEYRLMKETNGK